MAILLSVAVLRFPSDQIVGTVDWVNSWDAGGGPILATGAIEVPAEVGIRLEIAPFTGKAPSPGGGWTLTADQTLLDLGFIEDLPAEAIESVSVRSADPTTFTSLAHLAPGLKRLTLVWTGFGDQAVATIARLTELTYLQTFGNRFTDAGVQQLSALQKLEHLYLEEETLTLAAFEFATRLPRLTRLGLQDVPLSRAELDRLRRRLPDVDVG